MMKVFSAYRSGRLTVSLQGELDHHEVKQSMSAVERLLDEYLPRSCILDLSSLRFMDSSGIALILKLHRMMGAFGGTLRVENATGQPLRVIDTAGIDRMIAVAGKEETVK